MIPDPQKRGCKDLTIGFHYGLNKFCFQHTPTVRIANCSMLFPKPEGEKTDSVKEEMIILDGISRLI